MGQVFGTDGIRASANDDLTPELALAVGRALVTVLREHGTPRPEVVIGRDPRWSGELLEAAVVAGILSAGGDPVLLGILPTPAVAQLVVETGAAAGVMLSASHNHMPDNGIKIFSSSGFKLDDADEARLEEHIIARSGDRPVGDRVGRVRHDARAVGRYIDKLVEAADTDLSGIRVVVDGANGAASHVAPAVYRRLGAEVVAVGCEPDGRNINEGVGSTHPHHVCGITAGLGFDVGLALDGDADRLIAAAGNGLEVDGDVILALLARDRHDRGRLPGDAVVTTVMTNLGFKHAMSARGIEVVETKVGDRYVLEAMRARALELGGEQSGHLIQLDRSRTGDGVLSGVSLLEVMKRTGVPLRELAGVMARLPQVLLNVPEVDKARLDDCDAVWDAVRQVETKLGDSGRVLVRSSGTEPLVRVMVEAPTTEDAEDGAEQIAAVVRRDLALA